LNRYEAMVILPESLTEDEIEKGLVALTDVVKNRGGKPSGKPARMGRKPFARPMAKQTSGEYALLRFEMAGDGVSKILQDLKPIPSIFRVQITRIPEAAKP